MADKSKAASWGELAEKAVELGLGAALLTKEAATRLVDGLVKQGAVKRGEAGKLVAEIMEKGKGQREKMEALIAEVAERVLARADLARRSTVEDLKKRVSALEQELARQRGG